MRERGIRHSRRSPWHSVLRVRGAQRCLVTSRAVVIDEAD
nr:MAG TPA_asm: Flavivirus DEAD domain [Caudoviricetes sp.]